MISFLSHFCQRFLNWQALSHPSLLKIPSASEVSCVSPLQARTVTDITQEYMALENTLLITINGHSFRVPISILNSQSNLIHFFSNISMTRQLDTQSIEIPFADITRAIAQEALLCIEANQLLQEYGLQDLIRLARIFDYFQAEDLIIEVAKVLVQHEPFVPLGLIQVCMEPVSNILEHLYASMPPLMLTHIFIFLVGLKKEMFEDICKQFSIQTEALDEILNAIKDTSLTDGSRFRLSTFELSILEDMYEKRTEGAEYFWLGSEDFMLLAKNVVHVEDADVNPNTVRLLNQFARLCDLILTDCTVSPSLLEALGELTELKRLSTIRCNWDNGGGTFNFDHGKHLSELCMKNCQTGASSLSWGEIAKCRYLGKLEISNCHLIGQIPDGAFSCVEELCFCGPSYVSFNPNTPLPQLRKLEFIGQSSTFSWVPPTLIDLIISYNLLKENSAVLWPELCTLKIVKRDSSSEVILLSQMGIFPKIIELTIQGAIVDPDSFNGFPSTTLKCIRLDGCDILRNPYLEFQRLYPRLIDFVTLQCWIKELTMKLI